MVEDLGALNAWVSLNFPSLEVKERRDGCGSSFLSVTSRSCHPVLMTLPSVQLNIFVQVSLFQVIIIVILFYQNGEGFWGSSSGVA